MIFYLKGNVKAMVAQMVAQIWWSRDPISDLISSPLQEMQQINNSAEVIRNLNVDNPASKDKTIKRKRKERFWNKMTHNDM